MKDETANMFGFVRHISSVVVIHFYTVEDKDMDNMAMKGLDCVFN